MNELSDRIAVVTGGSRGIGAAVAKRLAADGATVALVYKANRAAAADVAGAIRSAGGQAEVFQADVADQQAVGAAMQQIGSRFGRIDVLANIAGVFGAAALGELTREMFHEQFDTNTWGVVTTTQAVLPYVPSRGGSIIHVSTSLVYHPRPGTSLYSASKAALELLTHAFAIELGPRNIRVNAVAPAITRTDMTAGAPAELKDLETSLTPLSRLAEPEDIADVVAFFASDDSRWVTGRTLRTDGGRL